VVDERWTSSTYSSMSIAYTIPTILSMRSSNTGTLEVIMEEVNDKTRGYILNGSWGSYEYLEYW
jgi:hypothetical protein